MTDLAPKKLTTCLWFEGNGREAAEYYVNLFPNSRLISNWVTPIETPGNQAATEVTVDFEIFGQQFVALTGGPMFKHSHAVSFMIPCKDQAEVDFYWNRLIGDGGQPSQCGWLTDKFGISWQVIPNEMSDYINGADAAGRARATAAMLEMTKLDVAELRAAYLG